MDGEANPGERDEDQKESVVSDDDKFQGEVVDGGIVAPGFQEDADEHGSEENDERLERTEDDLGFVFVVKIHVSTGASGEIREGEGRDGFND